MADKFFFIDVNHPGCVYKGTQEDYDRMVDEGCAPSRLDDWDDPYSYVENGERWEVYELGVGVLQDSKSMIQTCPRCGRTMDTRDVDHGANGKCLVCTASDLRYDLTEAKRASEYTFPKQCACCGARLPNTSTSFPLSVCSDCSKRALDELPSDYRGKKIALIKAIRTRHHLGLKEAKNLAEACLFPGFARQFVEAVLGISSCNAPKDTYLVPLTSDATGETYLLERDDTTAVIGIWEKLTNGTYRRTVSR